MLTKLHIPTSKAIALAAMPTAVVVGMGLTPKLAMADDGGAIPFAAGPCVTRSDAPSTSAKPSESPSPSDSASGSSSAAKKTADKAKDASASKDGTSPSASPSADGAAKKSGTSPDQPSASSSSSPTAAKTKSALDPLGVGDALSSLLGGGSGQGTASPSTSPSATGSSASSGASKSSASSGTADTPVSKVTDTVGAAAKKTADDTAQKIRDAAVKAGKSVKELPSDAKGLTPKKDTAIPDGAKPSYPCPTADPKALAAADLEKGIPALPDEAWTLKSSMLTLDGLDYKGIVEVRTGSGKIKKVLKFTSKKVDIKDLHQLTVGPNGATGNVKAAAGSTSKIRGGLVTMYTESLQGNLFGLIPVTFSPETPPPLNVPYAFFTNVTVKQAGQFGGTLTVPGLHNFFTGA